MAEKYNQSKLPVKVQQKVDSLNTDWIKLKDLADNLEPVPEDSSILEVLEQGIECFAVKMARNCLEKEGHGIAAIFQSFSIELGLALTFPRTQYHAINT